MRQSAISLLLGILITGSAFAAAPVPTEATLQDYAGHYELADGRILIVTEAGGKLAARIAARNAMPSNLHFGGPREVVLVQDGPAHFHSTSTPLQINFSQDARGDVAQVRLTEQADPMRALARR